jgi:hypothetical protein
MRFLKYAVVLAIVATAQLVSAAVDSVSQIILYSAKATGYDRIAFCDTARSSDKGCFYETDTGDSYDGSYINFNYKDTAGYAGFKIDWDAGVATYELGKHGLNAIVLAHKGPLSNATVTIRFGYNLGTCGSATTFQTIGTFKPSTTWKIDTIPYVETLSSVGFFYEMQFLINDTGSTVTPTNNSGCLKIDDIYAVNTSTGVTYKFKKISGNANSKFFIPSSSGIITLAAYSIAGELIAKKLVNVESGKQYSVNKFVKSNSEMSKSRIYCVKINGAGIDRTVKFW